MIAPDDRRLCASLHAPREEHDGIVRELIGPLLQELGSTPELDAAFFGRYNKPDWHLRLAIVGRPAWVEGVAIRLVERRAEPLCAAGRIRGIELAEYDRELERFGGEESARIAERIYHRDSLACIEWLDAEARGAVARSRREHCLLLAERYLDLLRLTRPQRIAFYRHSYAFEVDLGRWEAEELQKLERHYATIREGLLDLFSGETSRDPAARWGGEVPSAIAGRLVAAIRPEAERLLDACSSGPSARNPIDLAWTLAHMQANRLQVEADAEAIIRYFMFRLHQEADLVRAGREEVRP